MGWRGGVKGWSWLIRAIPFRIYLSLRADLSVKLFIVSSAVRAVRAAAENSILCNHRAISGIFVIYMRVTDDAYVAETN